MICSANLNTRQYEPFRVDRYHNKGEEDSVACENQPCCCLCVGTAKIMKPMSHVDFIRNRTVSREELISEEMAKSRSMANIMRVVSFVVMVGGIYLFFSPIIDLLGYIPLVGGFLKGTVGVVVFLGALIVSIPLYILTFSLAWLRYHPIIGLALLLVVAIIVAVIVTLNQTIEYT